MWGIDLHGSHGGLLVTPMSPKPVQPLEIDLAPLARLIGARSLGWHREGAAHHALLIVALDGVVGHRPIAEESAGRLARRLGLVGLILPPSSGLEGIRETYRRSCTMLPLARERLRKGGLSSVRELTLARLLSGDSCHRRSSFGPCSGGSWRSGDRTRRSAKTLRGLLEWRGERRHLAERQLYCHKNTFFKRMRRVEALTCLDFDIPADQFRLSLAVKLLDMIPAVPESWA